MHPSGVEYIQYGASSGRIRLTRWRHCRKHKENPKRFLGLSPNPLKIIFQDFIGKSLPSRPTLGSTWSHGQRSGRQISKTMKFGECLPIEEGNEAVQCWSAGDLDCQEVVGIITSLAKQDDFILNGKFLPG